MIKDIKYQGYSAVPSDYECLDGDLAGSYNLVPEDGAMHPVMPPRTDYNLPEVVSPATGGYKVLFIHHGNQSYKHYIVLGPDNKLYYFNESATFPADVVVPQDYSNVPADTAATSSTLAKCYLHKISDTVFTTHDVNAIGNTLIVNGNNGITYFLWSTSGSTPQYEALGQKPPMLEITFGLESDFAVWPETKNDGSDSDDFKGTILRATGRDSIIPQLGRSIGDDGAGWAAPRPVMAADSGSGEPHISIREFAANYATFSIENVEGNTDDEKNTLTTIKSTLTNGVFAVLNRFVNRNGTEENKFVLPFFVRYAYRLYDNSYIMHSYPVLMVPNSKGPIFALEGKYGLGLKDNDDNYIDMRMRGRVYGCLSSLVYSIASIPANLTKWKDLITSVDIAVSAPIYAYDQAGTVYGWTNMDAANSADWEPYYTISRVKKLGDKTVGYPTWGLQSFKSVFQAFDAATRNNGGYGDYFNRYDSTYNYPNYLATIPLKKNSEVNDSITSAANFYIIKQFSIDELSTGTNQDLDLDDGVLGGLLGRKTLTDDYHTHDTIKAPLMYNFNGRVNYSGIERTPHNPLNPGILFPQASAFPYTLDTKWQVEVSIKNDMQTLVVQSDLGCNNTNFPHWVFYPDANAKFAYIKHNSHTYELKLTPHDYLNGAYWLGDITKQDVTPTAMSGNPPTPTTGPFIEENKVYTSEVNNPFYIPVTGINTVGTGKILGICAAVKALSQGQFGQFPLYCFTTEGVWALETSSTGTYIARQPVTRDVCTNVDSITQLDDCVTFATDRGIMLLSGSTSQCITDGINSDYPFAFADLFTTETATNQWKTFLATNGYISSAESYATSGLIQEPFSTFLIGCRMIYDYVHQRIIVYNTGKNYAYIYSLKDHKWGMMQTDIDYGINSYPEALAVTDGNKVVNLSVNKTSELVNNVSTPIKVKGILVTRPVKLDQPDALKTIDTIIQRGKFDFLKSGRSPKPIRTILYGSRDLYNWFMVSSSNDHYLRGFSGTPYKYFRIVILCDFLPDESVYGATIQYKPRYLNRPR